MKKALFAFAALALVVSVLGQASASSIFSPEYHTYVLGYGNVDAGYTTTSSSTYEKTSSSVDTPWGSEDHVKLTRTSTDSFQPNYQPVVYVHDQPTRSYSDNYYDPYYGDFHTSTGDFGHYDTYYNRVYTDSGCSAWHCKPAYNYWNYGNDAYGQPYYYQPSWDWHSQVFNWAY